jgi:DNA-directed RNA polymerase sigma subunit (sigma70/sigma32)
MKRTYNRLHPEYAQWKLENRYHQSTYDDTRLETQIVRLPSNRLNEGMGHQYEELSESLADEENYNSELESEGDVKLMNMVLRKFLTRREEDIIRNFYGIGVEDPMGFRELANRLDLSPQRVREIRDKGLSKLRARLSVDMFN